MMKDGYFLPRAKARVCRWVGIVFLFAAAVVGVSAVVGSIAPGMRIACDLPKPCVTTIDPAVMLDDDEQAAIGRDPAMRARVEARAAQPWVRIGMGMLGLIEDLPAAFVLLALGLALRRLGTRAGHALARAISWLKQAARVGVVWAIVPLFTDGARSLLFSPATGLVQLPIDLNQVPLPLLLSVGAYASAWAIEAGIRAERDLAEFV